MLTSTCKEFFKGTCSITLPCYRSLRELSPGGNVALSVCCGVLCDNTGPQFTRHLASRRASFLVSVKGKKEVFLFCKIPIPGDKLCYSNTARIKSFCEENENQTSLTKEEISSSALEKRKN